MLALTVAGAEPSVREHPSLNAARQAALVDRRPVLAIFGATWCAPCQELHREVLDVAAVRDALPAIHLVRIDVDAERQTAADFAVTAVPTLILMNSDAVLLAHCVGALPAAEFTAWVKAGVGQEALSRWSGMPESGKRAAALPPNQQVPSLIAGSVEPLLSARVEATETLRRLAPEAPLGDPWASADERRRAHEALVAWWATNPTLPASPPPALDVDGRYRLQRTLAKIRVSHPVPRTEAMNELVLLGEVALPEVRRLIGEAEAAGDIALVHVLDEVRWTILLPQAKPGVVHALARGDTDARREAASKVTTLAGLIELTADPDVIVRERAIQGLDAARSQNPEAALAAVVRMTASDDANLRIAAAQALGKFPREDAVAPLAALVADPNEVVACTAIEAIVELRAMVAGDALLAALKDERWRVRAAAVQALGSLGERRWGDDDDDDMESLRQKLGPALLDLFNDPDAFVVKNAVEALTGLNLELAPERLIELARRTPDLAPRLVSMLIGRAGAADHVNQLYRESPPERRAALLAAILDTQEPSLFIKAGDVWGPTVDAALADEMPAVRLLGVKLLACRSYPFIAARLDALIDRDETDPEMRLAIANVVMQAIAFRRGVIGDRDEEDWLEFEMPTRRHDRPSSTGEETAGGPRKLTAAELEAVLAAEQGIQPAAPAKEPEPLPEPEPAAAASVGGLTGDELADYGALKRPEPPAALLAQQARWHARLAGWLNDESPGELLLAVWLTAPADAPEREALLASLLTPERVPEESLPQRLLADALGGDVEDSPLRAWLAEPDRFIAIARLSAHLPGLHDRIADPATFLHALEAADEPTRPKLAALILGNNDYGYLLDDGGAKRQMAAALLAHGDPLAIASGLVLAQTEPEPHRLRIARALRHENPWVRLAAVHAFHALMGTSRTPVGGVTARMLSDPEPAVRVAVAAGLLQPAIRQRLSFTRGGPLVFRFGGLRLHHRHGYERHDNYFEADSRAPRPLAERPAWLAAWADAVPLDLPAPAAEETEAEAEDPLEDLVIQWLLMAQYGDFRGIPVLVKLVDSGRQEAIGPMLVGITLSGDDQYLPALRKLAEQYGPHRVIVEAATNMKSEAAATFRRELKERQQTEGDDEDDYRDESSPLPFLLRNAVELLAPEY